MYKQLEKCRNCKSNQLKKALTLGDQYLSGTFPKDNKNLITKGPLSLVLCEKCSLLQLAHSYNLNEMYGENYGYRSGLNQGMVNHLNNKIKKLEKIVNLKDGDVVIDIGSNDATTLKAYKRKNLLKIGIDPTANKFKKFYTEDINLLSDFFSFETYNRNFKNKKAKIITSISMFYDLEEPNIFIEDINNVLDDEGIWHFEQSYMPTMLKTNSYDTICHEHLEFYSLKVIAEMLNLNNLKIIDIEINSINGGSIAVTACKIKSSYSSNSEFIDKLIIQENTLNLTTIQPYQEFFDRIIKHKEDLVNLVNTLSKNGKKIVGYGASTKGNVLLQYCGFDKSQISCILEINEEKYNCYTPGTNIPIVAQAEVDIINPDYYLVLPWHFRNGIIEKEVNFRSRGGKLIFPLPEIEIV